MKSTIFVILASLFLSVVHSKVGALSECTLWDDCNEGLGCAKGTRNFYTIVYMCISSYDCTNGVLYEIGTKDKSYIYRFYYGCLR